VLVIHQLPANRNGIPDVECRMPPAARDEDDLPRCHQAAQQLELGAAAIGTVGATQAQQLLHLCDGTCVSRARTLYS
jgi:hypothetical protein